MADVFISYKSERRLAAEHLKRIIEAHAFDVWYDYRGLVGGPDFGPQIEQELRGAKVAIVLWCDRAPQSKWVREEATLANSIGNYLPVIIAPKAEPPLGLRLNQHIDLSTWNGSPRGFELDSLLTHLERMVGRPSSVRRADLQRLDEDWRLYGAPSVLALPLEKEVDERSVERSWTAPQILPAPTTEVQPPVPQKKPAAVTQYSAQHLQAAERGIALADKAWNLRAGVGVAANPEQADSLYKEAFPLLLKAGTAGIPEAQFELARCYWFGYGVEVDEIEGLRWLHIRVRHEDNSFELEILADWYRRGGSQVAANKIKARELYARSGRESALLELAEMHENGEGGPTDMQYALTSYKELANNKDPQISREAQRRLIRLGEEWY